MNINPSFTTTTFRIFPLQIKTKINPKNQKKNLHLLLQNKKMINWLRQLKNHVKSIINHVKTLKTFEKQAGFNDTFFKSFEKVTNLRSTDLWVTLQHLIVFYLDDAGKPCQFIRNVDCSKKKNLSQKVCSA